jgi:RIO kinase 1
MSSVANDERYFDYYDYDPELNGRRRRKEQTARRPRTSRAEEVARLADRDDTVPSWVPSYVASLDPKHFEREWVISSLRSFYQDNHITDVLRRVKGGKEANVYCCEANPATGFDLIAAKLYRPRMLRSLKNDALYKEGRQALDKDGKEIRGGRLQRALYKKTDFGQQVSIQSWIMHEFETMTTLYAAGVELPRPLFQRDNALLMEYLGDETTPAPVLQDIGLERSEARELFERLIANVERMLAHNIIHGDLSAYNVLYWDGEVRIIDFPQAIDARFNRNAAQLLARDVERLCQYFARYGVRAYGPAISGDLWRRYEMAEL